MVKKVIKNGTLVTPVDTFQADILIEDEIIAQIGRSLQIQDAEIVDATDKLVAVQQRQAEIAVAAFGLRYIAFQLERKTEQRTEALALDKTVVKRRENCHPGGSADRRGVKQAVSAQQHLAIGHVQLLKFTYGQFFGHQGFDRFTQAFETAQITDAFEGHYCMGTQLVFQQMPGEFVQVRQGCVDMGR